MSYVSLPENCEIFCACLLLLWVFITWCGNQWQRKATYQYFSQQKGRQLNPFHSFFSGNQSSLNWFCMSLKNSTVSFKQGGWGKYNLLACSRCALSIQLRCDIVLARKQKEGEMEWKFNVPRFILRNSCPYCRVAVYWLNACLTG